MDKLASPELRRRINAELMRDYAVKKMEVSQHTAFFIQHTFGRIFTGNNLSFKNALKALSITLLALVIIVLLYSLIHNVNPTSFFDFADTQSAGLRAIYIMIVVGIVVLCDIISFLQTAMFLRFVSGIKSFADMIFLAICDLVITINIFVFIFPLALVAIFHIDDVTGRTSVFFIGTAATSISEEDNESNLSGNIKLPKDFREFIRSSKSRFDTILIAPFSKNTDGRLEGSVNEFIYFASQGMSVEAASTRVWAALGMTLEDGRPPASESPLRAALMSRYVYKQGTLHLSHGFKNQQFWGIYNQAYTVSHEVQDQFLGLLLFEYVTQPIKSLLFALGPGYMAIPHETAKEFVVLCDEKVTLEDTLPDTSKCSEYSIAYVGGPFRDLYYWLRITKPPVAPIVVSVFASTGLFLAALFYASLTLYVLTGLMLKLSLTIGVSHGWFDLEKNPFTLSAGILILTATPVFLLLAQLFLIIT